MAVLPTGIGPVTGGYQIERSLRFNSADSAYLNRTPASAGNRKIWTWSGWVKRSILGTDQVLFGAYDNSSASDSTFTGIFLASGNTLTLTGWSQSWRITTQVFRDVSSWYHIVVALDTTQATANNRVKVYVNGAEITAFGTTNNPTQNADLGINATNQHGLGRINYLTGSGPYYFNGYLTEVNFIDGQALTPSSFGETDSNTGVWKPKAYSGTYGTNGFYLKFADNSGTTSTTLGKDSSGNGNNWTPNNFSVTAGAGNDSLVDTPTSYGTDTGVGGEVRGNYCTWNPLSTGRTLSNGNLDYAGSATGVAKGTLGVSSGKWYWEILANGANASAGVASVSLNPTTSYCGATADSWCLFTSGDRYNNGSATSGYSTFTTNDIISIALDMDNGKVYWAKNGVWQGSSNPATGTNAGYTNLSGYTITPANGNNNTNDLGTANFGQRPFAYTAPSGFKALCTQNLPTPTIGATSTTQANDYFDVKTWSGNSSTQSIALEFAPGLIWNKSRSGAAGHSLWDVLRGTGAQISSSEINAESTGYNAITSFSSNAISLGADNTGTYNGRTNETGRTYVGWVWNAGGSNATNTSGSITSTVRANTTSGFSIVQWTGSGANGTVGHGLGVAPQFMFMKNKTNSGTGWPSYHAFIDASAPQNYYISLADTAGRVSASNAWNNTAPTSSVFSVGSSSFSNGGTMIAYVFAPVAGYSAFGSYTGNGSADGPFVYCGFRPKFVLFKAASGTAYNWAMYDSARDTYNILGNQLAANSSAAEGTFQNVDFLSNGFKVRGNNNINESGATLIYAAFAESPFKYSLAR